MDIQYDMYSIILKSSINELCFNYSYDPEEYRRVCIIAKNKLNELIEDRFKDMYAKEMVRDSAFRVFSPNNVRYCQCVVCKRVLDTPKFVVYGGRDNNINRGICRMCDKKREEGILSEEENRFIDEYDHYDFYNTCDQS